MHEAWQLTFLILAAFTSSPLSAPEHIHLWDKWLMNCLSFPLPPYQVVETLVDHIATISIITEIDSATRGLH